MALFYRFCIRFYQKYISPYKGFRCAHSVLHGGPGCSGAVLTIVEDKGLIRGFPQIRARFQSCKAAYLSIQKDKEKKPGDRKSYCTEACDCGSDLASCSDGNKCLGSISPSDCGPCDVGDCGVGSCSL